MDRSRNLTTDIQDSLSVGDFDGLGVPAGSLGSDC